ncbi:MAG: phosphatase domain-containing protein, partial [Lacisediminihabitans sp.]
IKWLLIGDDGQHDEQLYDSFAGKNKSNIGAVAIRQLSNSEAVLAGGRSRADERSEKHSIRWIYAPDGAGLADQMSDAGILPPQ